MIKLSLCMIVKNEQDCLARALDCVTSFADEIIIVDTGSTDKTKEIARKYTDKVFDFVWCDDFSAARNFSFSKATGDYLMWLDADDVIPTEEQEKIIKLKEKIGENYSPNVIMCKYIGALNQDGTPAFYYFRERILKNGVGFTWAEPVHECIAPFGEIVREDICIYHKKVHPAPKGRNLKIYRKLEKKGYPLSARALYYYGRELYYNGIYKKAIRILNDFLDTKDGWLENKIDACFILSRVYLSLNDKENAKLSLLRAFVFAPPRPKTACMLGELFKAEFDYKAAKFWYKVALNTQDSDYGWIETKFSTFTPAIELCVCCYNLGEKEEAKYYHEMSKSFNPNSPAVLYNEKFFK